MDIRRCTACLLVCWLLPAPLPGVAEVYRCKEGDTTVFSDVPCAEDAQVHRSSHRISIVAAPTGLDEIAARNRAFVDARREDLADRRRRAAESRRSTETNRSADTAPARPPRTLISPFMAPVTATPFRRDVDPRFRQQRDRSADSASERDDRAARRNRLRSRSDDTAPIVPEDG